MAAEEGRVVTALPPPPAYYKLFTPKATVDKEAGDVREAASAQPSPPAKNEFPLEPPPLPGPGATYKMFGMPYSAEPVTLELLPPEKVVVPPADKPIDFRVELKALLNSIMANYVQFMEMLVSSPSRAHEKLSDLETLFVNMHSLLNRYRSHQARHLLLERLRRQAEEHAAVTTALEAAMVECQSERLQAENILVKLRAAAGEGSGGKDAAGGEAAPVGLAEKSSAVDGPTPMEEEEEEEEQAGGGKARAAVNGAALHVDILLKDIKDLSGKLLQEEYRASWRGISELKQFID